LIGTALVPWLAEGGHRVVALRRASPSTDASPTWNPDTGQVDLDPAVRFDAVVHLAGENIAQRWTPAAKARILASRADATRLLSEALVRAPHPPKVFVTASAIGFYGDRGDEVLDEESHPGTGFLAEVCQAWEAATLPARQRGVRVVHLRLGIVLARQGGALAKMLPAFRLGLGGTVGSGRQYWAWITLEDVARAVELSLRDDRLCGAINTVAPEAVTSAGFAAALSRALHRPAFLPVPSFLVRAAFGEMGRETLLASARVRPARLLSAGFKFHFPDLDTALSHLLARGQ
jgi:uncharacterized protein (TIGR01777 family)